MPRPQSCTSSLLPYGTGRPGLGDLAAGRITISDEYPRAAQTYDLSYRELKDLARASLEYAFLPGRSLWRTPDRYRPVDECAADRRGRGNRVPAVRRSSRPV
jgi:adenosine deaminase